MVNGYSYRDLCHGVGDIIWWIVRGRMYEHVCMGRLEDCHIHLVKNAGIDNIWRGRASSHGNVVIVPPTRIYAMPKKGIRLPYRIFDLIYGRFSPDNVMVDIADGGLTFVSKNR